MFDEIESSVIVKKGEELLRKYMDGKKNLDKRIVENEQWYKMLHWEQIRDKDNGRGRLRRGYSTAWRTSTQMPWTTTHSRAFCRERRGTRRMRRCFPRLCL